MILRPANTSCRFLPAYRDNTDLQRLGQSPAGAKEIIDLDSDRADLFSKTTDSGPVDDGLSDWLVRHFRGHRMDRGCCRPSHVKEADQRGSDSRNGTDGRHRNDMLTG